MVSILSMDLWALNSVGICIPSQPLFAESFWASTAVLDMSLGRPRQRNLGRGWDIEMVSCSGVSSKAWLLELYESSLQLHHQSQFPCCVGTWYFLSLFNFEEWWRTNFEEWSIVLLTDKGWVRIMVAAATMEWNFLVLAAGNPPMFELNSSDCIHSIVQPWQVEIDFLTLWFSAGWNCGCSQKVAKSQHERGWS